MARTSKFAHLKPQCEIFFKQGKTPRDVFNFFPQIPLRTLQDWHSYLVTDGIIEPLQDSSEQSVTAPVQNVLSLVHSADSLDEDTALNDIDWAKRECKRIFRSELSSSVKLQSVTIFLKAVQLEQSIKREPDTEIKEELDTRPYEQMSPEELTALYREKLS